MGKPPIQTENPDIHTFSFALPILNSKFEKLIFSPPKRYLLKIGKK